MARVDEILAILLSVRLSQAPFHSEVIQAIRPPFGPCPLAFLLYINVPARG